MIHEFMPIMCGELNDYFHSQFTTVDDMVVLCPIVNLDGKIAVKEENKLIVSLINIERDGHYQFTGKGETPTMNINIYVSFAAYFNVNNNAEALKFVSGVVGFFQGKPVFNPANTPGLNPAIQKVTAEIVNIPFSELGHLWGVIGGKYLHSVIYKFRSLNIEEDLIEDEIPIVSGITEPIGPFGQVGSVGEFNPQGSGTQRRMGSGLLGKAISGLGMLGILGGRDDDEEDEEDEDDFDDDREEDDHTMSHEDDEDDERKEDDDFL